MLAKLRNSYRSFVLWFNALAAGLFPFLEYAQQNLPLVADYLPKHIYGYAFSAVVIGNILLRFHTTKDLANK